MSTIEVFSDPVVFHAGPVAVTRTVVTSVAVSAALLAIAAYLRRSVRTRPNSLPAVVGFMGFEALEGLVTDIVGRPSPALTIFSGSLFLFIVASNLSGQLPGVHPPTANLVTTSALAVVVFFAAPAAGIHVRGARKYLGDYLKPNPLLLPLHVVSELSRTLALSVRLFGNIMSGHLIVALLVALTGLVAPMPLMALDLLIGLLQAYIFALLSTVYIGAAIRSGEEL